jgi:tellurite resistance protein TerC
MEAFLALDLLDKPMWIWLVFFAIILILLVIDLGVLHRDQHEIGVRESLKLSASYITVSLLFGLFVWWELGQESALEYYTGYIIEKSLSIDNIFVMAIIFSALYIPRKFQHRVLFWGIIGVIVMRGIMIGLGAALVHNFHWVLYIFAGFLLLTGIKLLFMKDEGDHGKAVENNPIIKFLKKNFHITEALHGQKFFIRQPDPKTGKMVLFMTPLFLALVTIEFADLIFAVDSVPAIFRNHDRHLHRLYQQRVRDFRPAGFVLRAVGDDRAFRLSQIRARADPDFHRLESLPDRFLQLGEIPGQRFARRHDRAAGGRRAVLAL